MKELSILTWLKNLTNQEFADIWNRHLDNNKNGYSEPEYIYSYNGEYYTTIHNCEGRSLLKYSLPLFENMWNLEDLIDAIMEDPDEYDYIEEEV